MDFTLLVSFLAFAGMITSWVMLPTGATVAEEKASTAALVSTSKA